MSLGGAVQFEIFSNGEKLLHLRENYLPTEENILLVQ